MPYIYRKGNYWYAAVYINKKRKNINLGLPAILTKRQVKELLAIWKYKELKGEWAPELLLQERKRITLFSFIKEFEEYLDLNPKSISAGTIYSYQYSLKLLKESLGDIPLFLINKKMLEQKFTPSLYARLAIPSVKNYLSSLRAAFNKAIEWEYISKNPFSGLVPTYNWKKHRYFQIDEIAVLREYFGREKIPAWQYDCVFLALNTGMRREELVNLSWEDVYLDDKQLISRGKGRGTKKERWIPLNREAMEILTKRQCLKENNRVFPEITSKWAIDSMWDRLTERTNINKRFHDLRHTFASYYVMNGGSLKKLQDIMGHEDFNTTLKYADLSPASLKDDIDIVNFKLQIKQKAVSF